MVSWLRMILTDDDDQYDLGFVWWSAGILVFLGLSIVNWAKFDPQGFGIGLGSALGGGGMMSWLRNKTPRVPDQVVNAPNASMVNQVQQ